MESNLRPLTLGEILDRTAQLYRSNFLVFAGIFAIYCGVGLVINLIAIGLGVLLKSWHVSAGKITAITLSLSGIELLVLFLLFGAAVAATSRAVAWLNLGEHATIRGAYASVMSRVPRVLWLMTITAFIVWIPIAILYAGFFGTLAFYTKGFSKTGAVAGQSLSADSNAIIAIAAIIFVLLLIPALVYTIMMTLRYALALPACIIEDLKARAAIRRSIQLSKGARGRIFVLGLLIFVIKLGLGLFTQLFFIVFAFKNHGQVSPLMSALSQVIGFFTNSVLGPMYAVGITLFYYDQRVRKEGFDIEWMMQAAGMTVPPSVLVPEVPAASPDQVPETAHE